MVEPSKLATLEELPLEQTIRIEDVQVDIDQSEIERNQTRGPNQDIFGDFQTLARINSWMTEKANANPGKAVVFSAGKSVENVDINGIHIGQDGTNTKKVWILHCGIHAREWITPPVCLWLIDQLLGADPQWGEVLVKAYEWIIIPSLNVDGYLFTWSTTRLWRKNRQPNTGSTCIGTDLNRNFAYEWGKPGGSGSACSETYWGSAPFSGPETVAIKNQIEKYWNGRLISYWDIHAYGSLWMSPWGYTGTLPGDYPEMRNRMSSATTDVRAVNGRTYAFGSIYNIIYQTSGGSIDWSYGTGGIVQSYSIETFGNNFTPPTSYIRPVAAECYAGIRRNAIDLMPTYAPWMQK